MVLACPAAHREFSLFLADRLGPLAQQAPFHGEQGGPGPRGDPDLGVDVLDVVVGRLRRDEQAAGHLLGCETPGNQSEHLHLAVGQPPPDADGRVPAGFLRPRQRRPRPRQGRVSLPSPRPEARRPPARR